MPSLSKKKGFDVGASYDRWKAKNSVVKTYHEGANDERTAILAKVRRMLKSTTSPYNAEMELFENWLLKRSERYKKNPGGL